MLLNYLDQTALLALIAIVLSVGCYQTIEKVGSIHHEDDLKISRVALNLTAVPPYVAY